MCARVSAQREGDTLVVEFTVQCAETIRYITGAHYGPLKFTKGKMKTLLRADICADPTVCYYAVYDVEMTPPEQGGVAQQLVLLRIMSIEQLLPAVDGDTFWLCAFGSTVSLSRRRPANSAEYQSVNVHV